MDQSSGSSKSHEWKVRRVGTATFSISKPKRKRHKLRQSRIKNKRRAR